MKREWLDDELCDVLQKFHSSFKDKLGYSGRGSKTASQKVVARVLRDEILPNVSLMNVKEPKSRRQDYELHLKMF